MFILVHNDVALDLHKISNTFNLPKQNSIILYISKLHQ